MPTHLGPHCVSWASVIDEQTREQALKTAQLPFIYPHLALMPDAHLGMGATVGSVIPTLGAIIPAAVGVDIGCGMIAARTQFSEEQLRSRGDLAHLREAIEAAIPVSAGVYNESLTASAKARVAALADAAAKADFDPAAVQASWPEQLGTLGGGNHFIEITADDTGGVWAFLHSGSRGIGNKIATRHIKVAAEQCKRRWIALPDKDLAYLVEGEDEFWAYIRQLRWAQAFALASREEMMDRTMAALADFMGEQVTESERINCHHNYTEQEKHFHKAVWVSRKGAINAALGRPGLIPGSMGTASYVVAGKGNPVALRSAPHGAGRLFSRRKARETFSREELREAMVGIEWRDSAVFLDEIPAAYKPIDQVMADSAELVEVRHQLHQLVNVKGE